VSKKRKISIKLRLGDDVLARRHTSTRSKEHRHRRIMLKEKKRKMYVKSKGSGIGKRGGFAPLKETLGGLISRGAFEKQTYLVEGGKKLKPRKKD